MQSDHQMARMGDDTTRPVPRFEIVHKPQRVVTLPDRVHGGTNDVEVPNPEPWSVRFIGGNGEEVWRTSESYVDVRDAEHAISLLVEALGSQAMFEGVKVRKDAARPGPVPVLRVEVGP